MRSGGAVDGGCCTNHGGFVARVLVGTQCGLERGKREAKGMLWKLRGGVGMKGLKWQ